MKSFDESFYTVDFDQGMLDFIGRGYKTIEDQLDHKGEELVYSSACDCFWTNTFPKHDSIKDYEVLPELTKEQFKQKIGMALKNTTTVKDDNIVENNTFTKSDLKDGMLVRHRGYETLYMKIGDMLLSLGGYNKLSFLDENLLARDESAWDVVEVYENHFAKNITEAFDVTYLKSIWKRTPEKTPVQIELEEKIKTTKEMLEYLERQLEGLV